MRYILMIMFSIAGQLEGPYLWANQQTRQPIVYASEAECEAEFNANVEAWLVEERAEHKTDDVKAMFQCHEIEPGQPV